MMNTEIKNSKGALNELHSHVADSMDSGLSEIEAINIIKEADLNLATKTWGNRRLGIPSLDLKDVEPNGAVESFLHRMIVSMADYAVEKASKNGPLLNHEKRALIEKATNSYHKAISILVYDEDED
jgi:hypothetical protein|tara:strand:- start:1193 stop:1570 length:378 start_codon:yes stop_codon:yes gene_type:complete